MRIEIDPQALIYTVGRETDRECPASRSCFFSKGYWIFIGARLLLLRASAFSSASEDEQRAFIRDALSYMSAEAVERSTEAVAFGRGEAV